MVSSTLCPAVHILGSQNVYGRAEGIADHYWPWAVFFFFPLSVPLGFPASSKGLPVGLPAGSEALPAGSEGPLSWLSGPLSWLYGNLSWL